LKHLALIALLAGSLAFAQEHATPAPKGDGHTQAGGAEAVHPGGAAANHAQDTAKHGEGHEAKTMPNEIWWKWANFALLAVLLGWLIKKNAGPFFAARTQEIQGGIAEASKVRADAEARAADIERRVSNLSAEVEALRQKSREEITREGERVRAETQASIAKIQAQAEAEIASAGKHASHELKAYSAKLALDLAERQIRERMTAGTQEQLTDGFVADLRGKVTHN
jgi:F-type H+-transporting ATPase subunit b